MLNEKYLLIKTLHKNIKGYKRNYFRGLSRTKSEIYNNVFFCENSERYVAKEIIFFGINTGKETISK